MGAEYGAGRALTKRLAPKTEALACRGARGLIWARLARTWRCWAGRTARSSLGTQASEESQSLHGELAVLQGCRHVCGGVPAMARKGPQRCGRGPSRGLQKVRAART